MKIKKISSVLFLFFLITVFTGSNQLQTEYRSSDNKIWRSKQYIGYIAEQEVGTWCTFACMEMYDGILACVHAQSYLKLFSIDSTVLCCERPPFRPSICENGVQLRNFPHFLSSTYNTPCKYIQSISNYFNPPNIVGPYRFPCFGLIDNYNHCVYVIGIERKIIYNRYQWILYFIDPWFASLRSEPIEYLSNPQLIYL